MTVSINVAMTQCVKNDLWKHYNNNPLLQIVQKYDLSKEEELRGWIEDVTGHSIGPDFQKGLKDGIILCK